MARSRSTLFAALALIASATMPKAKGPARSKKPGCSIRISAGAAIWCMTPSHKRKLLPLEVRRSAEAEDLGLVESGLEQRLGDVGTEGAKRRIPNDAEAGRHTNLRAILDEASLATGLPKIASGASARKRRQDRGPESALDRLQAPLRGARVGSGDGRAHPPRPFQDPIRVSCD